MDETDTKVSSSYFFGEMVDRNVLNFFRKLRPDFEEFIVYSDIELAIQDSVDDSLFYSCLEDLDTNKQEPYLEQLRNNYVEFGSGEGGSESVYQGFMLESDPNNITNEQIDNLVGHKEVDHIFSVFSHLKEIGYDFNQYEKSEYAKSPIINYINAFKALVNYKLEMHKIYKTDKGDKIVVVGIDSKSESPKYAVKFNDKYESAGIETINNLVRQRQLFNKKQLAGIKGVRESIRQSLLSLDISLFL